MRFFNITTKKTYKNKRGEEKNLYPFIGRLTQFDDGKITIDLNMFPNTKFYVFEIDEKKDKAEEPEF